jgi:site-specific recombinase XerD
VVGYSVYLGVDHHGQKQRRFFTHLPDAEKCLRVQNTDPRPVGELLERKAELLYCLEQLRPLRVSLPDVVSFYVRHHGHKGNPTLAELVELFVTEKKRVGRSVHYEKSMRYCLNGFIPYVGNETRVGDITREQITNYVYQHNRDAGVVTKKNILTHLSVLFNFAIKEEMLGLNPVDKITRPTIPFKKPHVLSPVDFSKLLHRCLEYKWYDRLVIFVLVGFCGIRTEEGCRLSWSHLHLDRGIVELPAEFAKKARFRNNPIPSNGLKWLNHVVDKRRTGRLIGDKWNMMLRSAISSSAIDYRQNCIRHSFCSYALAAGWTLADVIAFMGHNGSSSMIFSHYRNVVSEDDGKKWFSIVP